MKEIVLTTKIKVYTWEELSEKEQQLVLEAKEATYRSYAPYSGFCVGAAVMLDNGVVVCGNNQENAAYPSGLCAERVALFSANAAFPGQKVKLVAIAARQGEEFVDLPVSPCGACRQVMLECEERYGQPLGLILYGTRCIYVVESSSALMPLSFGKDYLKM